MFGAFFRKSDLPAAGRPHLSSLAPLCNSRGGRLQDVERLCFVKNPAGSRRRVFWTALDVYAGR